jgi:hypothetical protein
MRKLVFIAAAAAVACGCTKRVYVPLERVNVVRDTFHSSSRLADTLILRDSVVLDRSGDTVRERTVRERWRLRSVHDTVRSTVRDTVVEPRIVEVEKEKPRSLRGRVSEAAGWMSAGVLLGAVLLSAFRVSARKGR